MAGTRKRSNSVNQSRNRKNSGDMRFNSVTQHRKNSGSFDAGKDILLAKQKSNQYKRKTEASTVMTSLVSIISAAIVLLMTFGGLYLYLKSYTIE